MKRVCKNFQLCMDPQGKIFCKICLSLLGFAVFLFIITIYDYGKWWLNFEVCIRNCLSGLLRFIGIWMEWSNFCITHSIFSREKSRGFSAVSVIDGICFEILGQNDFPSFLQSLFVLLNHVKGKKKSNFLAIDFLFLKSWETKTISQLVCNWFLAIVWCLCLKFWDIRNFKIACKDKLSVTGRSVRYRKNETKVLQN